MIPDEVDAWLRGFLSPARIRTLQDIDINWPVDRRTSVIRLLIAWRHEVLRMQRELGLPDDDRTARGVHDLIGALHLRNMLEVCLDKVTAADSEQLDVAVRDVDDSFRGYTEPLEPCLLARISGDPVGPEWWWQRVPRTGPIRAEYDQIRARM